MAIKDSKMNISQKAVQKTKKVKSDVANHIATIDYDEDGDSGSFSVLQNTTKMKKKKHLVKQKDPDKKATKKKKQSKKESELKNKECANLPIMMEISSYSKSLTDTRNICKTAKNKGDGTLSCERESVCEVPLEGLPVEQEGSNFFNRLARKRSAPVSNRDDVEFIVKKKKKKKGEKEGHKHACPLMLLTKDAKNETPEQIFPNPKVISQETPLSSKEKGWTDVQNGVGDIVKKKKAAVDNQESNKHILEAGIASTVGRFHKGHLSKKRTWGCEEQQEDDRHVSEEETKAISQKGRKKKLKKEKVALFVTSISTNENSLTLKSKTQLLIDLEPGADEDCKMMKKNQTQTRVGSNRLALLKDGKDVSVKKRKEKKGKKCEVLQVHTGSGNEDEVEEKKEKKKKKKKKGKDRESKEFQNCVEGEPGLRKAKLKREVKQRRQALQEENDLESGRMKVVKREKESDVHFGQWGTAVFENSERKAKFLRLLGGFKKGPSVPTPDSPASATKLTMALDRSQEKELRQSLEAEFEKAVTWKHRRGTGLGFQPAAQKQAYIDKYASKSIKFED